MTAVNASVPFTVYARGNVVDSASEIHRWAQNLPVNPDSIVFTPSEEGGEINKYACTWELWCFPDAYAVLAAIHSQAYTAPGLDVYGVECLS